ncbi:hypothetical protein HDU79_009375 [Rhizoclosmatium sp. JEL0117]|nr:hypothetical protein HDU79_009375 [Rhizoclosmatium sp. JEL0117]
MPNLSTLPPEVIKDIFGWIDPRCAHRYRELCRRINEVLDNEHFARLNLKRFIDLTVSSKSTHALDNDTFENKYGVEFEPEVVSAVPNTLDLFCFAFPADYRKVYIHRKVYIQLKFSRMIVLDWDVDDEKPKRLGPEVSLFGQLRGLSLKWFELKGSIPTEIGDLRLLRSLVLEHNRLEGAIPASIGLLSNLTHLELGNNCLEGEIPSELMNLVNLVEFCLPNNRLHGSIPAAIGNMTKLTNLDLSSNTLSGFIPSSVGSLRNLRDLSLAFNRLSGSIPPELGQFGLTSEDGTVSVSPDGLDHLFFSFPNDYRTVYAQSRLKDLAALSWGVDEENDDAMLHPFSKLHLRLAFLRNSRRFN